MPSYSTIPVSEETLVKPQGKSIKALVVGAAVASFVIGALAATAVTSSAARAPAALYEHEAQIKMELFPNKCVAVADGIHRGAPLKIENCKDTPRQAFVADSEGMEIRVQGTDLCVALLGDFADTAGFVMNEVMKEGSLPTFGLEQCIINESRKLTFDGINKDGKAIELTLPGKQKWPISANKDGKIDKYEHVKVCMMPQIMDEKRIDDKHLDLEEKLYGAALMGLPCNKVDPVNFWYVDTKKHAPYQYPQPKGITIPGKVWDSENGSWVDEE